MRSSPVTRWLRKWPKWPRDPSQDDLYWKLSYAPCLESFEDALREFACAHSRGWCALTQHDICDAACWYLGGVFPAYTSVEDLWHALPKRASAPTNITALVRWLERIAWYAEEDPSFTEECTYVVPCQFVPCPSGLQENSPTNTGSGPVLPGFVRAVVLFDDELTYSGEYVWDAYMAQMHTWQVPCPPVVPFEDECADPCSESSPLETPVFAGALFVQENSSSSSMPATLATVVVPTTGRSHDQKGSACSPAKPVVHAVEDTPKPQLLLAAAPVAAPSLSAGERNHKRVGWQDGGPLGVHVASSLGELPGVPLSATDGLGMLGAQDRPPPKPQPLKAASGDAPAAAAAHGDAPAAAAAHGNAERAAAHGNDAHAAQGPAPGLSLTPGIQMAVTSSETATATAVMAAGSGPDAAPPVHTKVASLLSPCAEVRDDPHDEGKCIAVLSGCAHYGSMRQHSSLDEAGHHQTLGNPPRKSAQQFVEGGVPQQGADTIAGGAVPNASGFSCPDHLLPPPEPPDGSSLFARSAEVMQSSMKHSPASDDEFQGLLEADEERWVRCEMAYAVNSGENPCSEAQLRELYKTCVRPGRLADLSRGAELEFCCLQGIAANSGIVLHTEHEHIMSTCTLNSAASMHTPVSLTKAPASRGASFPDFWLPPSEPPDVHTVCMGERICIVPTIITKGPHVLLTVRLPKLVPYDIHKVSVRASARLARRRSLPDRYWGCGSGAVT